MCAALLLYGLPCLGLVLVVLAGLLGVSSDCHMEGTLSLVSALVECTEWQVECLGTLSLVSGGVVVECALLRGL